MDTSLATSNLQPLVVDVKKAAEMLGVSAWSVREYVNAGELKSIKLPSVATNNASTRRLLFAVDDLREFIARYRA